MNSKMNLFEKTVSRLIEAFTRYYESRKAGIYSEALDILTSISTNTNIRYRKRGESKTLEKEIFCELLGS